MALLGLFKSKEEKQIEQQHREFDKLVSLMESKTIESVNSKPEPPKDSPYVIKNRTKRTCKRKVKVKFVVGKHYVLHTKSKENSKPITREFECKKFIYSMKGIPMNIVIMKQVAGPTGKKYPLDKVGCRDYHIKWEPGLEIYAMEMFWIPKKEEN